jgi:E3 ubiquitin-protein ligase HECTD1
MGHILKKTLLEVEYEGEEGTGLGPTLEYYYLTSKEIRE